MPDILDDNEKIKGLDKSNFDRFLQQFPEFLEENYRHFHSGFSFSPRSFQNVIICGMGGSAISGDVVSNLMTQVLPVNIFVSRGYTLPAYANKNTLVILVSYSGETEETLSSCRDAEKKGISPVVVASGGKILKMAQEKKWAYIELPKGFPPRAAFPVILAALLTIFEKNWSNLSFAADVSQSVATLKKLRNKISLDVPLLKNFAKQMAQKLKGKLALVYSPAEIRSVAYRMKSQFNENAKKLALHGIFPELNHNELAALGELKRGEHNFALVILRSEIREERVNKSMDIVKSLISPHFSGIIEIAAEGHSLLERMLYLVYVGDYLSYYVALAEEKDPSLIEAITKLKRELSR